MIAAMTVGFIGMHDPSLPLAFRLAALFDVRIEDIFDPELDTAESVRATH